MHTGERPAMHDRMNKHCRLCCCNYGPQPSGWSNWRPKCSQSHWTKLQIGFPPMWQLVMAWPLGISLSHPVMVCSVWAFIHHSWLCECICVYACIQYVNSSCVIFYASSSMCMWIWVNVWLCIFSVRNNYSFYCPYSSSELCPSEHPDNQAASENSRLYAVLLWVLGRRTVLLYPRPSRSSSRHRM